jgi:formate hydrogenlyase subunit 3/multisubunit Na+/H+ antiporter MnhD subunit
MSALISVAVPLILALMLAGGDRLMSLTRRLAVIAPLVLLWPLLSSASVVLNWPLLSIQLGVDAVSSPLILLTAVGWSLAGWLAFATIRERCRWFWSGWLLALSGMSLLLLAADMASFYAGYVLLSLSAYLLVTYACTAQSWRAGRIYLIMTLAGEACILAGIFLLAGQLGNPALSVLIEQPDVLVQYPARWLLMTGFAVKLGIIPVHLWLPLAHPVAPVPASAILSGIIVKAGLLGWLRFVPALGIDTDQTGLFLFFIGMMTALGGVLLGLVQARIKSVLAYSTISQMGLLMVAFSLLFFMPDQRHGLVSMIGLIALHHGLNKAALFVACDCAPGSSRWRLLLFALPALSLLGLPISSGFLAKGLIKAGMEAALLNEWMIALLSLSSTATAVLMWKAWRLARQLDSQNRRLHPAWPLLVLSAIVVPWVHAWDQSLLTTISAASLWAALWPLIVAVLAIGLHYRYPLTRKWQLPEGDLVVVIEAWWKSIRKWSSLPERYRRSPPHHRLPMAWLKKVEARQRQLPVAGLGMLIIGGLLWLAIWWSQLA